MSQSQLSSEASGNQVEPLLPVEKKLIAWSLGLGIALLIILAIVNELFPAHL